MSFCFNVTSIATYVCGEAECVVAIDSNMIMKLNRQNNPVYLDSEVWNQTRSVSLNTKRFMEDTQWGQFYVIAI